MSGHVRVLEAARRNVEAKWGGVHRQLGRHLYEAVLAREVLVVLADQDDDVSDARVRELLREARNWVQDVAEWECE